MAERTCCHCGRPGGIGKRELRPYGPGGADVCAGCVFGEDGAGPDPERVKEAERALARRFLAPGPHIIDDREEVGPRTATPREREEIERLLAQEARRDG